VVWTLSLNQNYREKKLRRKGRLTLREVPGSEIIGESEFGWKEDEIFLLEEAAIKKEKRKGFGRCKKKIPKSTAKGRVFPERGGGK